MGENENITRRPLKTRGAKWANAIAQALARAGVKPNHISLLSIVFALMAGGALVYTSIKPELNVIAFYLLAAACVQLRLLCNLLDGMVAIEGGLKSKSGEVFNDLPDRFADALIFIGMGYAAQPIMFSVELGYLAGMFAIMTAYIRVLGGSMGLAQSFAGPMAKQHRMAVVTIALLAGAIASVFDWEHRVLYGALCLIIVGSIATCIRRTARIIRSMESRP